MITGVLLIADLNILSRGHSDWGKRSASGRERASKDEPKHRCIKDSNRVDKLESEASVRVDKGRGRACLPGSKEKKETEYPCKMRQ